MLTPLLVWLQQAAVQHAAPASPASPMSGVLGELLRVLVVLALVSAGAFWALRWVARRGGLGATLPGADASLSLRVLARMPLEPRKALYLVRIGERTLLLGTGDAGPPSLLIDFGRDAHAPATNVAQRDATVADDAGAHGRRTDRDDD